MRGNNSTTEITTPITLINNALINERTGAGVKQYAVGTQGTVATGSGWSTATINYNLLGSSAAATLGLWGAADKDFASWKTTANTDLSSFAITSGVGTGLFNTGNLYTDIANGNLGVTLTNGEAWALNGKGIAGAASDNLNIDYSGNTRGIITGFGTDIGSVEFTPTSSPVSAVASGSPAINTTTTYTLWGQQIAAINWGSAGTVPSSVDVQYYTGTNAPNLYKTRAQLDALRGQWLSLDVPRP